MRIVNMLEAKTTLSRLVEAVESGVETEIIIARNGKPAARLVPIAEPKRTIIFGVGKGLTDTPEPDPELEEAAAALFRKSE